MAEPLTADQIYWFGWWTLNLPEAKRRGMTSVPTCAKEAAVLGLYEKSKKEQKEMIKTFLKCVKATENEWYSGLFTAGKKYEILNGQARSFLSL